MINRNKHISDKIITVLSLNKFFTEKEKYSFREYCGKNFLNEDIFIHLFSIIIYLVTRAPCCYCINTRLSGAIILIKILSYKGAFQK